jgi:aspartate aminotransferase
MLADLSAAPPGAVVLLHACAHNPTGVDPTPAQWRTLLALLASRRLLPFFDSAYQGFATGDLDQDAAAVRMAAASGQPMLLAQSFAKNMGMYGDRVGFLSVLCPSPAAQQKVFGQLRLLCRLMYSNPPRQPAAIVKTILSSPELMALWQRELEGMAGRIRRCRLALHTAIRAAGVPGDWEHVVQQQGMFSYTGLSEAQCKHLAQVWHVYLTLDGRLSLAGLSCARCEFLAAAIKDTVISVPA